jgi:peptide-methionine (R)-S-oxide reductase
LQPQTVILSLKEKHFNFTDTEDATGQYVCAACGYPLFEAAKKFDAGCGFPSFWQHLQEGVRFNQLTTYGRERTQVVCRQCGQHLGHLFPNKFTPTGVRYCVNKTAIELAAPSFTNKKASHTMPASPLPIEQIMQTIRENRSSESNYALLQQELDKTIAAARQAGNPDVTKELEDVKEKYAAEYEKSKETGGTAWPEFEKFVTQFERALTQAKNSD